MIYIRRINWVSGICAIYSICSLKSRMRTLMSNFIDEDPEARCPCEGANRENCAACQDLPVWYFDEPSEPRRYGALACGERGRLARYGR